MSDSIRKLIPNKVATTTLEQRGPQVKAIYESLGVRQLPTGTFNELY